MMPPSTKQVTIGGQRLTITYVCSYRGELSYRVSNGREVFDFDLLPDRTFKHAEVRAPRFEQEFGCSFADAEVAVTVFHQEREDHDIMEVIRMGGIEYLDPAGQARAKELEMAAISVS